MSRYLFIVNPNAGTGSGPAQIKAALEGVSAPTTVAGTQAPGHATELAAVAKDQGYDVVVAAGGDGTVHEVVNGLMRTTSDRPALGVVPLGSGCDYVKTFDISDDVKLAVERATSQEPGRAVDVGEITYMTPDGQATRYFANIAEVGFGPECVARAARLPRALGGAMYFAAFWLTLPAFKRRSSLVVMDDETYEGMFTNLVIAIGQAYGGGMRITPKADPSDGLFDVQVHHGSKLDFVRGITKVYKGTHIPHARVWEGRAAGVEVRCTPPGLIEADGEVLGHTPATFRSLPGALRLKV